jgi:hypothetical protein
MLYVATYAPCLFTAHEIPDHLWISVDLAPGPATRERCRAAAQNHIDGEIWPTVSSLDGASFGSCSGRDL